MTFPIIPASTVNGSYQISRSLRFRSSASAYLSRTPASAGNQQKWTWSCWFKRGALGSNQVFISPTGTTDTTYLDIRITTSDNLQVGVYNSNVLTTTQVFRDPSAWYHLVCLFDTTQANADNRCRLFINGLEITTFSTNLRSTYFAQNTNYGLNANTTHNISRNTSNSSQFIDGYLAEVNFIDGQALTPSSFGAFDTNGVWQPAKYTGSYGTNGFYLPFSLSNTASTYGYQFNQTPSYISAANTQAIMPTGNSTWSVEAWVNFSSTPSDNWAIIVNTTTAGLQLFWRPAINAWEIGAYGAADVLPTGTLSASSFINSWNHIVFTSNGTQLRIFINGVLQAYAASTYSFGAQGTTYIGSNDGTSTRTVNGYISNLRVCKGSIPTSYQTTSTTIGASIFLPPSSDLTSSSQGAANVSLLTAQSSTIVDNSSSPKTLSTTGTVSATSVTPFNTTANLAADASGAGNNWAPNNISLATGTTYDSMIDSPTNYADGGNGRGNYAILNPIIPKGASTTISNGNLTYTNTSGGADQFVVNGGWSNISKQYYEFTCTTSAASSQYIYAGDNSGYYCSNGQIYVGGSLATTVATYTSGDVLGFAVTIGGAITFYKNGTSVYVSSGSASGTPLLNGYSSTVWNANFGQQPFRGLYVSGSGSSYVGTGAPPSGFSALNTQNLPTPTIANGAQYMAATTYTGNGTAGTSITNGGNNTIGATFQPDFVWLKSRSTANSHALADTVRGAGGSGYYILQTNTTNAENTTATNITAINTDGFTLGSNTGTNGSGATFIGWQWQAGTAPTTDNVAGAGNVPTAGSVKINGANSSASLAGSIAATRISANTSAGFSVVTYTGTGANATVGHGLGVAPSMVIIKTRTASDWYVGHTSVGWSGTGYLILNNTGAAGQYGSLAVWQTTAPNSSVISLGTVSGVNANGGNYVAYCFAPVAGYSAFGSYTGNGSTDGPMIFTGFRPRYVLVKLTSAAENWYIQDSSRGTYNANTYDLFANLSNAEQNSTAYSIDFLSNGFKLRTADTSINTSSGSYIYVAFAENPFKYSRAR